MIKTQVLEAIKEMPNMERIEIIEFTLNLLREEITQPAKLSLKEAAKIMQPYYAENSELTEFVDCCNEDFYDYNRPMHETKIKINFTWFFINL